MSEVGDGLAEGERSTDGLTPADFAADLLAPSPLPRSNSANALRIERKPPHWSRRSLPPAKRERRSKNAKSQSADETVVDDFAAEPPIPRSKSVNFKRPMAPAGPNRAPRSLSFASGSHVRRTRRAQEDAEPRFLDIRQLYRRASIRSILPVVQQIKETKSRKWTVAIFSVIAAVLATLRGFTLGFSSNATLDLTGAARELPSSHLFSTTLISIFAVSKITFLGN